MFRYHPRGNGGNSRYEVALRAVLVVLQRDEPDEGDMLLAEAIAATAEREGVPVEEAIIDLIEASPWTTDGPRDTFRSLKAVVRSWPAGEVGACPLIRIGRLASPSAQHRD
jgi:hypothetical protein